ncbi:MAG: hypothetical protein NTW33_01085 [Methanoregula sp.]|nr:hypothetical protein [Methanoregula sp.]
MDNVDWSQYDWVGFSSSFEQHCASLALAKRIKSRFPDVRIIFGGSNCFGAMGDVLCRCFPFIDYVCTGEGDTAVPALVHASLHGATPPQEDHTLYPCAKPPGWMIWTLSPIPITRIILSS